MDQLDEPIAVLPIHYSNALGKDLQLHQFPLLNRPLQIPPSAAASGKRISARIKPNVRRIEICVPADTRPDVWNPQRATELGTAQLEDDREKNQEQRKGKEKENKEPRLSEVRLRSEEISQHSVHMLGIVQNGRLYLHPVSEIHQFRPTMTYLDMQSRKSRHSTAGAGSDSDSDHGPPPDPDEVQVPPTSKAKDKKPVEMREISVSTRKTDDKGATVGLSTVRREMLQVIRAEEDEEWQNYEYCDATTEASVEAVEALSSSNNANVSLQCKTDMTAFLKDISK